MTPPDTDQTASNTTHQQLAWLEDISKKVTQIQLAQERAAVELQGIRAVLQGLVNASRAKPGNRR